MKKFMIRFVAIIAVLLLVTPIFAEDKDKDGEEPKYDPVGTVMHHIADANEFHIGPWTIPLPCILYNSDSGLKMFSSSKFHHGENIVEGYVLNHGRVNRIIDANAPKEGHLQDVHAAHDNHGEHHEDHKHDEEHHPHYVETKTVTVDGAEVEKSYVYVDGHAYEIEKPSTLTAMTNFYDFSITKNVAGLFLAALIVFLIFTSVARKAKANAGKAPTGIQNFMEPFFIFIRDEVTRPMIGEKHYERFQPYIMTVFFFILILNLLGLVPFWAANVTGNIAATLVLAFFTFLVTNLNGNKHYWEHILWMPGIPAAVKLILTPVEALGVIIKPFSLMIRLFANITAGHIIILSLVGLVFVFGNAGESIGGAAAGAAIAVPFTIFMNAIELIVAFIQAFIFAILSASYIGAAVEEGHHHEEAH
ncbi:MAG: F0F1 ATP synthase subunit A [Saprospiraceae bacterium]